MKNIKFKEEDESESSRLFISEEIVLEILIKVDAKTLVRSKAVCTNWLKWISNQFFINKFIKKIQSNPPLVNGIFCRFGDIRKLDAVQAYFITTTSEPLSDIVIKDNSLSFLATNRGNDDNDDVCIVDSNNGVLLCTKELHYSHYFVFNPVTKHWVQLPASKYFQLNEGALLHCYNKDVNFAQKTECFVYCFRKKLGDLLEVEIYSSETGKWEESKCFDYEWCVKEFNCLTLLNKCAYWLHEYGYVVVCDLEANTLRFIEPPMMHMFANPMRPMFALHVGVSDGSLYFVERSSDCFFVWILGVDGQLCWHQGISIRELERVAGIESELAFKFLGFDQVTYRLLLVGIGREDASLFCVDLEGMTVSRDMNKSFFCNCNLKVFPYALPAWPTCIPFIKN